MQIFSGPSLAVLCQNDEEPANYSFNIHHHHQALSITDINICNLKDPPLDAVLKFESKEL